MRVIGVLGNYLTKQHKEEIEKTAALSKTASGQEELTVRYFQDTEEAAGGIGECEILYGYYPASMIKNAAKLKWLATAAAGVDPLLPDEVYPHEGVILTNSNGAYGVTISEHLVMTLLMLMRRQEGYDQMMRDQEWGSLGSIRSIFGSRFVIVGTGDIGTNFARRVKTMGAKEVIGVRRDLSKPLDPAFDKAVTLASLKDVVKDIDVIALCVPATKETVGLLSKDIIDSLDKKTLILNIGRGSAIDQEALIDALNEERIAGAALDVMVPEPLPKGHPLYTAKNVILTPHCSGTMTLGYTCDVNVHMFCENLKAYICGEPMKHVVDRVKGY